MLLALFATTSLCDETIEFAVVIYRHGDRTPVNPYPTDPWKNESLWPVNFGQLTNIGKKRHYQLGQWFRKRYSHLISKQYNPQEIYVRSTDVDRTLMSAQANLAGMYPPNGTSVWNPDLMWQPIPVHTVPEHDDNILAMKKSCPAYDKEHLKYTHSVEYLNKLHKYDELMHYLSSNTGTKIKSFADILDIYSTLYIEELNNFTLPQWTRSVYPEKMREPAGYSFKTETATPLLARLKVGPLMKIIVTSIQEVISNKTTGKSKKHKKLLIYSAHDLTIGNILNSLDMYDGKCPAFTSTILIELIHDDYTQDYYIRILYRNSTEIIEPSILNIPCCGAKCPFERFKTIYDNLISVKWDYECRQSQFVAILVMSFIVGMGLFATIYMTHKVLFMHWSKEIDPEVEQYDRFVNTHFVTLKVSMDCSFNRDQV